MAFEVTGKGGAGPAPGVPPDFIQFQQGTTNLGAADVDTVSFGTGMTATRGTGENASRIVVTAEGGAGAATLLLDLFGNTQAAFNGVSFNDWIATEQVASADASWVTNEIVFTRTGMYEVKIVGRVQTDGGPWGTLGETYYGSEISNARVFTRSGHSRRAESESIFVGPPEVVWTDSYFVNITDIVTQTVVPSLHADRYVNDGDPANMRALVSVTRIGDPLIEA